MFSYGLVVAFYGVFVFLLFQLKAWDRPESLLALFTVTTFIAPGAYFAWVEKGYSEDSLVLLNALGVYTLVLSSAALVVYDRFRRSVQIPHQEAVGTEKEIFGHPWKYWYAAGLSAIVFVWWLANLEAMPITGWFAGKAISRPDTVPSIRHFYTFSTILYFVVPSFYLLVAPKISKWQRLALLTFVAVLLASGGHKGVLTYFLIFLWWFRWGKRLNWKALAAGTIAMVFYALNMWVTNGEVNSPVKTVALSIKRFFVEQARGLLVRFDMVQANFRFTEGYSIKQQVAQYEWPGSTGSMPTAMFGDVYVTNGLFAALACITLMIALFFVVLYLLYNLQESIIFKWSIFIFLFLAFNVELSVFSANRYLAVALNLVMLTAGSFHFLKKRGLEL